MSLGFSLAVGQPFGHKSNTFGFCAEAVRIDVAAMMSDIRNLDLLIVFYVIMLFFVQLLAFFAKSFAKIRNFL